LTGLLLLSGVNVRSGKCWDGTCTLFHHSFDYGWLAAFVFTSK
jgi:hypothetical protein